MMDRVHQPKVMRTGKISLCSSVNSPNSLSLVAPGATENCHHLVPLSGRVVQIPVPLKEIKFSSLSLNPFAWKCNPDRFVVQTQHTPPPQHRLLLVWNKFHHLWLFVSTNRGDVLGT